MNEQPKEWHIYRLHEGQKGGVDWFTSNEYSETDVETIPDPTGASARFEITSIPSPFARLHVFETAFREVTSMSQKDHADMDGDTVYHKLVSHALDVGQIFFNYGFFKEKVGNLKIDTWHKESRLKLFSESVYKEHKLLGQTLDLYIKQADTQSNFSFVENIYILSYDYKVIGGTSPTTLFFCAAGDLNFVDLNVGKDKFFDNEYCPLHKREFDYQLYLHGLFEVYPSLKEKMPLIWEYLLGSKECLAADKPDDYKKLQGKLKGYNEAMFIADFEPADTGIEGSVIEALPDILHRRKNSTALDKLESDFTIGSYKTPGTANPKPGGTLPLVLQNNYQKRLQYAHGLWEQTTQVPYFDEKPLEARILPGQSYKYPYLTVSDFLEPTLIKLPFSINSEFYFNGNPLGFNIGRKEDQPPEASYILPIKDEYFKYFDVEDLMGNCNPEKQPALTMEKKGDRQVLVRLRIPIKKSREYLTFERLYDADATANPAENKGSITTVKFNLAMMPFINKPGLKYQRVFLASTNNDRPVLTLYRSTQDEQSKQATFSLVGFERETTRSDEKRGHGLTTRFFEPKGDFNIARISTGNSASGIILPKCRTDKQGNKKFSFAIDFGTTNTHIEYSEEGSEPRAFCIENKEEQLIPLNDVKWGAQTARELEDIFLYEAIPDRLGQGAKYKFPFRTVSSETRGVNPASSFALGDINIPFYFEDLPKPEFEHEIHTNLKWQSMSDGEGRLNQVRVRDYLETLALLIRNKILLNGGDITKTDLIWFLPTSMSVAQQGSFSEIWKDIYRKYFQPGEEDQGYVNQLQQFSESLVPIFGYQENEVKGGEYPVVNIDIGGETTDIAIFSNKEPLFTTSVKFAGNAVFGDGYAVSKTQSNGFVHVFKPFVQNFLTENRLDMLSDVLKQLDDTRYFSSADMMAFFFSLEKNPTLAEKKLQFSLTRMLRDHPEFNMVYAVFAGSLFYHIAKLMKKMKLEPPRNISLTGNGSKIIRLLNHDLKPIEQFAVKIFEKVYGKNYHVGGLTILQKANPKELTAKGGIKMLKHDEEKGLDKFDALVLLGNKDDLIINIEGNKYERKAMKYKEVTEITRKSVVVEVDSFVNVLYSVHEEWSFAKNFGINAGKMEAYRKALLRDLSDGLNKGLEQRKRLSDDNEDIVESLFFYPLIGSIYDLIGEISKK